MNYISKLFFISTLILGTLIVISSSSWLGIWIGLELNLLSFIPIIIDNNNLSSTESAIKYFLTQTLASIIFLFSSILYITKFAFFSSINISYENIIINLTLIIKLGAAPLHFWFPNIIENLSWINSLILITWQKLAPLTILFYTHFNNIFIFFIISSALVGAIGGLNQTSLRKLLTFSSINHIRWILIANLYRNFLWLFYFLIYSIISISIIIIFQNYNLFFINQIFLFNNNNIIIKFCLFLSIFSLGGLPPFLGFLPKWLIIENIIKSNFFFLTFIIIIINLITLFFYARLTYSTFILNNLSIKWNFLNFNLKYKLLKNIAIFNIIRIIFILFFIIININ